VYLYAKFEIFTTFGLEVKEGCLSPPRIGSQKYPAQHRVKPRKPITNFNYRNMPGNNLYFSVVLYIWTNTHTERFL